MSAAEVTLENLSKAICSNNVVNLDFWAPWHQPCVRFSTAYEGIRQYFPSVVFRKIETDSEQSLA